MVQLADFIRNVPDFPKPGIQFKDVSPLLADPGAFKACVGAFAGEWSGKIDAVAALDARGFIFGSALAFALAIPLVMVRKKGKLPAAAHWVSYGLEYGSDTFEMQDAPFVPGARVLVIDDLLATGGSASAAAQLVGMAGGALAGFAFVIELEELGGRARLPDVPVQSLLAY